MELEYLTYRSGSLWDFVQEYCEKQCIAADSFILGTGFHPCVAYSEEEAMEIVEDVAAQWHLRCTTTEAMERRN